MPLGKGIRFGYRQLPKKKGKKRRQRIAFRGNKAVEVRTEEKRNGWFGKTVVLGDAQKRGTIRKRI